MIAKLPLYLSVAQVIEERIRAGHYKPGHKIPTIRQMAADFDCNKLTVQRAFEQLKKQGLIENKVGSGSYVRFQNKIIEPDGAYDFRTDYLHESLFPHHQIRDLFDRIFKDEKGRALSLPPVEGDPELRQILSTSYHLPSSRMLIISGGQQGLDLVAKVFGTRISDSILFEDPTYPGAISLFKARHFFPMETDGPDLDRVDGQLGAQIQLVYTMPALHNPMGCTYSAAKQEALVNRARKHDFYIVEDDYLGELCPPLQRFADLCPERTIFIKSFAQTTLAGIRMGFIVVPSNLFERFRYAKYSSDVSSFGLLQKCLREFINQGLYKEHLTKVRREALIRRRRLETLLSRYSFLSFDPNQNGYSIWVRAEAPLAATQIPWCRGEEFSFSPQIRRFFRISFMHMEREHFKHGLYYLEKLLDSVKLHP